MTRSALGGVAFWLFLAAFLLCLTGAAGFSVQRERQLRNLFFVVDLTRSMTARDYGDADAPVDRLTMAKRRIAAIARDLPCGSRVGFGIFAERRSFSLVEPVEVCSQYTPFVAGIDGLDWRMAWEGDSRVVRGLNSAQEIVADLGADLVFVTDGQEAPPAPIRGRREAANPDEIAGFILGAGGPDLVPIPKYDDLGNPDGFYSLRDIAAGARVSIVAPGQSQSGEYHPRNNPVGNLNATSNEHLTSVKDTYLRTIAAEAGLGYAPLADAAAGARAIAEHTEAHSVVARTDLTRLFAIAALAALFAGYVWNAAVDWRPAIRRSFALPFSQRR